MFIKEEEESPESDPIEFGDTKMRYGGSLTWGRHFLIGKIILNFGLEFGYVHREKYDEYHSVAVFPGIANSSYEEIVRHHSLGFHMGIGYPLF